MASTATTAPLPVDEGEGVEEILSSSLQTLYEYTPITHSSANHLFEYTLRLPRPSTSAEDQYIIDITLQTPDTEVANWSLHASSVWVASIFIADHLQDLSLGKFVGAEASGSRPVYVLELGAGAGLPGIALSKVHSTARVTLSDFPDGKLIKALASNVERNGVTGRCRALPHAWGSSDASALFAPFDDTENGSDSLPGYDIVLAADTLWNSDLHVAFIHTLRRTLRKTSDSRVYLVAGLHTGRYTLDRFLKMVREVGFIVEEAMEREVRGVINRPWDVTRAETEDERERRRWVLWIVLKWDPTYCADRWLAWTDRETVNES
ncbi:hypothetical protein PUNSTDRAFT_101335 [Punctularia strigosozonata HHB-11173 SS5]|uniref:uncharacterized protein n=1 Tax=Punctularia strigosozonata (strain HHB-11173) TaxID=741275 RepID=UPI0004416FEA|nr:uncharacterized protein PUNSTDRAFT_101335 [Punctularia strigosozonata HHB-11173 SS5]EIN09501.1 hypothetical protein PUNSTDRAFT_101335 [Punctularia strigosozonata HHB-11173 SS5]